MATRNVEGWTRLQMLGLVVIALGAAFLVYSVYNLTSVGNISSFSQLPSGFNRTGGGIPSGFPNGSSSFPSRPTSSAGGGLLLRFGDAASGLLAILLGFMIFKYGSLKKLAKL
jgi:hypothetical protein